MRYVGISDSTDSIDEQSLGSVIWVTGLSDSGKTTVGKGVARQLALSGVHVIRLDGDELRRIFGRSSSYDRDARLALAYQYSRLCQVLAEQGCVVVISAIAMFREVYDWNRSHLPRFFQVYLKTPMEELKRRDTKGIYKAFDQGLEENVCGLDLKADEPDDPDFLEVYSPDRTPSVIVDDVIEEWKLRMKVGQEVR